MIAMLDIAKIKSTQGVQCAQTSKIPMLSRIWFLNLKVDGLPLEFNFYEHHACFFTPLENY